MAVICIPFSMIISSNNSLILARLKGVRALKKPIFGDVKVSKNRDMGPDPLVRDKSPIESTTGPFGREKRGYIIILINQPSFLASLGIRASLR